MVLRKATGSQYRLLISCCASCPRIVLSMRIRNLLSFEVPLKNALSEEGGINCCEMEDDDTEEDKWLDEVVVDEVEVVALTAIVLAEEVVLLIIGEPSKSRI